MDVGKEMARGQKVTEPEMQGQEAVTVSPEMLLAQLVNVVGEEFVVIPTGGWMAIVNELKKIDEAVGKPESILKIMEGLGVPVVPVSLAKKEEESNILTPDDIPEGESRIIMP